MSLILTLRHIWKFFEDTFTKMTKGCYVAKCNTSEFTPYKIAKSIVDLVDNINGQNI